MLFLIRIDARVIDYAVLVRHIVDNVSAGKSARLLPMTSIDVVAP